MDGEEMNDYEGSSAIETFESRAIIEKLWGTEEIIVNTDRYCGKILRLDPGYVSSRHYHELKDETFYVLSGVIGLEIGDRVFMLSAFPDHESIRVMPMTPHRFWAIGPYGAEIIEFSTPHSDGDVVRLESSGELRPN
jgi:mannose-6-phosphate isomerase-like protein (cupin superfamily)